MSDRTGLRSQYGDVTSFDGEQVTRQLHEHRFGQAVSAPGRRPDVGGTPAGLFHEGGPVGAMEMMVLRPSTCPASSRSKAAGTWLSSMV